FSLPAFQAEFAPRARTGARRRSIAIGGGCPNAWRAPRAANPRPNLNCLSERGAPLRRERWDWEGFANVNRHDRLAPRVRAAIACGWRSRSESDCAWRRLPP